MSPGCASTHLFQPCQEIINIVFGEAGKIHILEMNLSDIIEKSTIQIQRLLVSACYFRTEISLNKQMLCQKNKHISVTERETEAETAENKEKNQMKRY